MAANKGGTAGEHARPFLGGRFWFNRHDAKFAKSSKFGAKFFLGELQIPLAFSAPWRLETVRTNNLALGGPT